MYQIIQHALSLPNDKTKLTLIFSNVSEKDILLKETLDKWAKDHKQRFVLTNHSLCSSSPSVKDTDLFVIDSISFTRSTKATRIGRETQAS